MKLDPQYEHRCLYLQKMQDFVDGKISGTEFKQWFSSQCRQDMDEYDALLSETEKSILEDLQNKAVRNEIDDEEYKAEALKIIGPFGDNLFFEICSNLQVVDIEDFGVFRYAKGTEYEKDIPEDRRVDEEEFRRRVKAKLDLLEQNKGKW